MTSDELLSLFLAGDTEHQLRSRTFEQLVAAFESTYDQLDFCLRYVVHSERSAATLCALRIESLVFRTLVPQWAGRPRQAWSPADAAIRERLIEIFRAGHRHPVLVRALAAVAYEGVIDHCAKMLPLEKSFWHLYYLMALGLLSNSESTAVLVRDFRTETDARFRREAAETAAWSELLVEPERSEVEAYLLQASIGATGPIKIKLLFALALLKNREAVAEVAALAQADSLSTTEESFLRSLTSQKMSGVFNAFGSTPDWRPALLDWLRERHT